MMHCCRAAFSLLVLLLAASWARAEWPEFRGPTGQGLAGETELPLRWSSEQNVAWKRELSGEGWSSPIVHQGRIYLTSAVPAGGAGAKDFALRAACLSAADGSLIWQRDVFLQQGETAPRVHTKNSHASPTPLIDRDRLFVHFGHQGTACLDLDGKVLWRQKIDYAPVHGNGGSPILAGERLIFSCDGAEQQRVVALDRNSGDVLWQSERDTGALKKFSFSTPLLITVDRKQQVVSPGSGAVCAYDPNDGREIWRVRYDGYSLIPRPVFGHGLVYVCTGYDRPKLLAIRPDGKGDVTDTHIAWTAERGAPHTPSLLLVDSELYMISDRGIASCLDAKTGQVHWQERIGGSYSTSPLYAAGRIYLQSEDGVGTVIAARRDFREMAVNDLGQRTLASYAVDGRALLIRSASHLFRIEQ